MAKRPRLLTEGAGTIRKVDRSLVQSSGGGQGTKPQRARRTPRSLGPQEPSLSRSPY